MHFCPLAIQWYKPRPVAIYFTHVCPSRTPLEWWLIWSTLFLAAFHIPVGGEIQRLLAGLSLYTPRLHKDKQLLVSIALTTVSEKRGIVKKIHTAVHATLYRPVEPNDCWILLPFYPHSLYKDAEKKKNKKPWSRQDRQSPTVYHYNDLKIH